MTAMKKDLHPQYYPKAKVKCACGNTFTVGATKETMTVEICSHCHPFYTGTEKLLDIAGRVEKFRTRQEAAKKSASRRSALVKPTVKKKVPKESKLPTGQVKTAGKVKAKGPAKKK